MTRRFTLALLGFGGLAFAAPALAQDASVDSVIVEDGEGSGNGGRVAVNIAAGEYNQQAGSAVIAAGDLAVLTHGLHQDLHGKQASHNRATRIEIGPGAFSDNRGMTSLNITAGTQNQSANLASLNLGGTATVSDQTLAQTSAPSAPATLSAPGPTPGNDTVIIDDTAFAGTSGLVQLNVVGGERNSSANTFALQLSAGGER